jgi:hypothetical protein
MKAFTFAHVTIAALACTMSTVLASAQDVTGAPPPRPATVQSPAIQVTPFFSIDSRGSLPVGAAITFPLGASFSLESEVGYRRAEGHLNAFSTSANLLYAFPRIGRTTPYLASGIGLAQYGTPIVSREGTIVGTAPRVAFEVNAGGGLQIPVDNAWGMRTDARWFKSFGRDASEHWRVSHGVSFDVGKR